MRGMQWLQRILYLIIAILGIYILYKGGNILLSMPVVQNSLDSGEVQRHLEDGAVRTWAPGYAAAVEGKDAGNWFAGWMNQAAPVYSYLADGQAVKQESEDAGEKRMQTGLAQEQEASMEKETQSQTETVKERQEDTERQQTEYQQEQTTYPREEESKSEVSQASSGNVVSEALMEQLKDFDYLLANYYTVDAGTSADAQLLNADTLLGRDLKLKKNPDVPQILIYHTHSQETFIDSEEGKTEDSIIGMGEVLAQELRDQYGYQVIHDTGVYDLVDGVLDRSAAYDYARQSVLQILAENPTIEVVIDLHRDGVEGQKFVTEIDGKPTSMVMFFNGISRDSQAQPLSWLENPYIEENLAFSLQMQLAAQEMYPGFTRNIYLKAERFNLHLRPRSLLIEAGTQLNTVEEERNAMKVIARLLDRVLTGE